MLLVNANVVDVISGEILRESSVQIDINGKITSIQKATSAKAAKSEEIMDLEGRYLFPGLISCHAHLSIVFPFSLTDPNENPALTAFRAAQRAEEALKSGITTLLTTEQETSPSFH